MKKLRLAVAVAVIGSFSVLAIAPAQAQDYSQVTVNVSEREVVGGNNIQITATANIECDSWELVFLDQEASGGQGSSFTHTFTTPEVDEEEDHVATATCFYDEGEALGSGGKGTLGTLIIVQADAQGSGVQTLLPEDDDDDGDDDSDSDDDSDDDGDGDDDDGGDGDGDNGGLLPNTGGERLAWLIIGAMLVLVGGGVVVASRRRDA